jgi:hypothetical protein
MQRLVFTLCAATIAVSGAWSASSAAAAATLCVGGPGCFATIQAAVNAAHDGDTITIAPGTFAGGIMIDVSVNLVGTGANKTIINGGGPVVTIGRQDGPRRTVSISGVTISGGVNNSAPDMVVSFGGGVSIPWASGFTTGATVTISDSVITGNRVTPQTAGLFCGVPCAFAFGGGIDNAGTLTVTNTAISGNQAGSIPTLTSVTSGAGAGGIFNEGLGTLTLRNSVVSGNSAAVNAPNGSLVQAGGVDSAGAATIENSIISGNSLLARDLVADEADAFAGGLLAQGPLSLSNSSVDHNQVHASLVSAVGGLVFTDAGGVEADNIATITNTRIVDNSLDATAPAGTVIAVGGGLAVGFHFGVTVRDSLIARNIVTATSAGGTPIGAGGGVENFGQLTLERTVVTNNAGTANGASGIAHGGGISNETFPGDSPPLLTLTDSVVTANNLGASPGVTPQGGGLFTTSPATLTRTVVAGNKPDQCFGC